MTSIEFLLCIVLIFLSGFFSSSEVALFSLSRFQLRHLRKNFPPIYKRVRLILNDPGGLLITILVSNELVNISLSTLIGNAISTSWKNPQFAGLPPWALQTFLGTLLTAPLILFFCEITPKVAGTQMNQLIGPLASGPVYFLYRVFHPVRVVINWVIRGISRTFRAQSDEKPLEQETHQKLKEDEFLMMVEEGHKEGAVQQNELDLIRNVFELDNTSVAEIVTPLAKTFCLPASATIAQALEQLQKKHHYRIPVFDQTRHDIVGILYAKDLIACRLEPGTLRSTVREIMKEPYFVSDSTKLNALFRRLRAHQKHMAIVRDANGRAVGVMTMTDILDEIFDDLFPDEAPQSSMIHRAIATEKEKKGS